jgi:hypothetical protein
MPVPEDEERGRVRELQVVCDSGILPTPIWYGLIAGNVGRQSGPAEALPRYIRTDPRYNARRAFLLGGKTDAW